MMYKLIVTAALLFSFVTAQTSYSQSDAETKQDAVSHLQPQAGRDAVTPKTSRLNCNVNGYFGNQSDFLFNDGARYFTGRSEVCTSVGYTPVCRDSLTQTFMERFCQYVQSNSRPVDSILIGSLSDYIDGYTTQYAVSSVTCPPSSNDCTYQIKQTNCSDYGGIAAFSCLTDPTGCNDSKFNLDGVMLVKYQTSGGELLSGRLTACLKNEYVDICADDVSSSLVAVNAICLGSFSSYSYQPWSSRYGIANSGVVLTDISCNENSSSLNECTYKVSSIDQCSSGPLVVSCKKECDDDGLRIVNQKISYLPDKTYLTGHLELCRSDYRWMPACDDGSILDVLAILACKYYQFTNGTFIHGNNADSSQCPRATIQCYRSNECSSSSPSVQLSFGAYVNFLLEQYLDPINSISFRPQLCIDNQQTVFCNNTLTSSLTDHVCRAFGDHSGVPYPIAGNSEDYGINLVNNNFITSITCPMDGVGLDNCNITTGDTCDTPAGVITCYDVYLKYHLILWSVGSGRFGRSYDYNFKTGYAAVCDGSGYNVIPICRDGITDDELHYICLQLGQNGFTFGPLNGKIKGPISDTVATSVSCPVFSKNYECRFSSGNTCDDRGGFILMSCFDAPRVCNHGDVRITGGPNSYTGRPEFCYFGTWRTICGTEYYQADAAVTCQMAGFNHDGAVNVTGGMYGGNGMSPVLAGLRCVTGREGYFSNCNPINGDLLSTCDPSMAAAVQCEPLIGHQKHTEDKLKDGRQQGAVKLINPKQRKFTLP